MNADWQRLTIELIEIGRTLIYDDQKERIPLSECMQ